MSDLLVAPATEEYPRNSEGDLVELKDGRLLLAWTEFYGGYGDGDRAHIVAKTSSDGGLSWSEKSKLQENIDECNVMSVSLLRSQSGHLLLFYLIKNSWLDLKVMVKRSQDDGETWSESVQVSSKDGYNVMNNARVIQLQSGRLLAPVAYSARATNEDISRVLCYISDDDGYTWRKSLGDTGFKTALAQEPGLIERNDGSILMIIRTALDYIYFSESLDVGETWGEPHPSTLVSPLSPATITRIPNKGNLLMVWNNDPKGGKAGWEDRTSLTAAISADEGLTWTNIRNIEGRDTHCWAYTSITFISNKVYLTYYEWPRSAIKHFDQRSLKLRILPIEWFYS